MRLAIIPIMILWISTPSGGNSAWAEDGATLKGRIVAPQKFADQIPAAEFKITLNEQVSTDSPPVPENWAQLTTAEQEKWWNEFQVSEAGKDFIAEQDKKIEAARSFNLKLETDGRFVVYDVPPAVFELYGKLEKKVNGRDYVCEVFGQLEVVKGAQEVELGELEILVSPIFRAGDSVPPFDLQSLDHGSITLENYKNKLLLINFWTAASPPASNFQKQLQAIVSELQTKVPLELLAVSLDESDIAVKEFLNLNGQVGKVVVTQGWNHPVVAEFGLHGIPSLWLIGPDGKFKATDQEFGIALRESGLSLQEVIAAKIEGREIPLKLATPAKNDDDQQF